MTKIFDGKTLAQNIREEIKKEVARMPTRPGLAVILVGEDPASLIYVRNKKKAVEEAGVDFHSYHLAASASEEKILEAVNFLNNDKAITGIIVQLPLPGHIDANKITQAISPEKDVDGFHPENIKKLLRGEKAIIPPTSQAVLAALDNSDEDLTGKKIIVLANSMVLAVPIQALLEKRGFKAELVIARGSASWPEKIKSADVLIVAIGQPRAIKKEMVKEGAIVIDIGTSYVDGKTVGDVDFDEVKDKVSFITPTPGGIGPLTVAFLLKNVMEMNK